MHYKILFFLGVLLLYLGAGFLMQRSAQAHGSLPSSNVYETPANFQRVLDAGNHAPEVWDSLTAAEQDEILAIILPDLVAQGKHPRLVGVSLSYNVTPGE